MRRERREYFAEWLNRTMANKGLTGAELAEAVGVADSAVSRWKNGRGVPPAETCFKLATVLGVHGVRLTITAGHMPSPYVLEGVEYVQLPLPEDSARHAQVREQIMRLRGVSPEDKEAMFALWEGRQRP